MNRHEVVRREFHMRLLFSATPAYGHILPLATLMGSAIRSGHSVALLTSGGIRAEAAAESAPDIDFLPAGAMPAESSAEAAAEIAARPSPVDAIEKMVVLVADAVGG